MLTIDELLSLKKSLSVRSLTAKEISFRGYSIARLRQFGAPRQNSGFIICQNYLNRAETVERELREKLGTNAFSHYDGAEPYPQWVMRTNAAIVKIINLKITEIKKPTELPVGSQELEKNG